MTPILTPANITFALGIIMIAVNIVIAIRKPQEGLDKREAVNKEMVDGKAAILASQLEWEKTANERRFKEFGENLNAATALAQNHIHSIDVKVDGLFSMVGGLSKEIVQLRTIIEERVPRKE